MTAAAAVLDLARVVVEQSRRIERFEAGAQRDREYAQEMERQRNAFGEALTRAVNGEPAADVAAEAMESLR